MSSQRYSELKDCESARKELKEALAEAWENQASLRELNAELLGRLKEVHDWACKNAPLSRFECGPPIVILKSLNTIAKAEKLK